MSESECSSRTSHAAVLLFQCSCNESRLKMVDLLLQSSTYQFFLNGVHLLHFVHHYVTAAPQTFSSDWLAGSPTYSSALRYMASSSAPESTLPSSSIILS